MLHSPVSDPKRQADGNPLHSAAVAERELDRLEPSPQVQHQMQFSRLQNAYGNQAVLRMLAQERSAAASRAGGMLQRKCGCGKTAGTSGTCTECQKKRELSPQSKRNRLTQQPQSESSVVTTITPTGDEEEFATLAASNLLTLNGEASSPEAFQMEGTGGTAATHHCRPTARFTRIPSGTLPANFGSGKFGAQFNMNAEFNAPIPCNCVCGEYRQFVRGYAKHNGTSIVHPLCSNTMSRTTWYEDCKTVGGRNLKYGYHSIPFATSRFTNPDQATGCTFNGFDFPGFPLSSVTSGDILELHLEFKGKLVDACDGDRQLVSSDWVVEGTGTVP